MLAPSCLRALALSVPPADPSPRYPRVRLPNLFLVLLECDLHSKVFPGPPIYDCSPLPIAPPSPAPHSSPPALSSYHTVSFSYCVGLSLMWVCHLHKIRDLCVCSLLNPNTHNRVWPTHYPLVLRKHSLNEWDVPTSPMTSVLPSLPSHRWGTPRHTATKVQT